MIIDSLRDTQTTNIEDYEIFFEKYLDYKFTDFVGDKYNALPISLLVNYSEHQHEGAVTLKLHSQAKSVLSSSESIKMTFRRELWKGVEA